MNKTWLLIETFVYDKETIIAACSSEEKARELALTYRDKYHPWEDLKEFWKEPTPEWKLDYYAIIENEKMLYASPGHSSWGDVLETVAKGGIACYISIRSILTDQLFGIPESELP